LSAFTLAAICFSFSVMARTRPITTSWVRSISTASASKLVFFSAAAETRAPVQPAVNSPSPTAAISSVFRISALLLGATT